MRPSANCSLWLRIAKSSRPDAIPLRREYNGENWRCDTRKNPNRSERNAPKWEIREKQTTFEMRTPIPFTRAPTPRSIRDKYSPLRNRAAHCTRDTGPMHRQNNFQLHLHCDVLKTYLLYLVRRQFVINEEAEWTMPLARSYRRVSNVKDSILVVSMWFQMLLDTTIRWKTKHGDSS